MVVIPETLVRHETYLYLLISLLGVMIVLFNTQLGAFWGDDTYYYIQPARDFIEGNGFNPSYIFGPVLPFILSIPGLLNIDPLISVRWINAILFGTNLYLLTLIIRKITASPGFALCGGVLILLSDVVIEIHGWAMSEALAIAFLLSSILSSLAYLETKRRVYGILTAVGTALAVLTRFAMLPTIPAICLMYLIGDHARPFLQRLRNAILLGITSLIPILLYWLRNFLISGHPVRYEQYIQTAFDRSQLIWWFYHWFSLFIPGRFLKGHELSAGLILTFITGLLLLVTFRIIHKARVASASSLFKPGMILLGSLIVFNLLMLYLARGLTELNIYNARYLVPIFIVFIAFSMSIFSRLWQVAGRYIKILMVAAFLLFLVYYSYRAVDFTLQTSSTGLGYSNIGWHQSETIRYLQEHPGLTDMVSTGEMGIYFWTGRKPTVLAAFTTPEALSEYMCAHGAPLFIMSQMPTEMYGFTHNEATRNLRLARQFNDAEMYVCQSSH